MTTVTDTKSAHQPVALVTGSGRRRIGWHVAAALAARGYAVAIHYYRSAESAAEEVAELRSLGAQAEAFQADLRDEQQARRLVAEAIAAFGRLDVLVTAAAIWYPKQLAELTAADVKEFFETNTLGTFLCCQHAGLAMARQAEGGSIVTIGDWAVERPYLNYAAYFLSKGSIETLTRCLAVELAGLNPNVRVNCVLPGPVMLPPDLPPQEREASIRGTLLRREGRPANVVQAVLHFIENDFVTGACLPVDGGRTIGPAE
ncbi:MAG: SDR family oxidoreductase [Pirellulales bacterium]